MVPPHLRGQLLCSRLMHSNRSCCLFVFLFFQALKAEEKTFSYQAELEILDSTICKANAMEVTFQPVKCPTQVRITFKGARRYQVLKT